MSRFKQFVYHFYPTLHASVWHKKWVKRANTLNVFLLILMSLGALIIVYFKVTLWFIQHDTHTLSNIINYNIYFLVWFCDSDHFVSNINYTRRLKTKPLKLNSPHRLWRVVRSAVWSRKGYISAWQSRSSIFLFINHRIPLYDSVNSKHTALVLRRIDRNKISNLYYI